MAVNTRVTQLSAVALYTAAFSQVTQLTASALVTAASSRVTQLSVSALTTHLQTRVTQLSTTAIYTLGALLRRRFHRLPPMPGTRTTNYNQSRHIHL
jgi:hypothetical protein